MSANPTGLQQVTQTAGTATNENTSIVDVAKRLREVERREQALKGALTKEQLSDWIKRDRSGFAKEYGLDLKEPEADPNDPVAQLKAEMEALKRERAEEQARKDADRKRTERMNQLKEKGDAYKIIEALEAFDPLYGALDEYERAGQPADIHELASQHQNGILEQLKRLKDIPEVAAIFRDAGQPPRQPEGHKPHPLDTRSTLTQDGNRPVTGSEPSRPMTDQERFQAALSQLKFT